MLQVKTDVPIDMAAKNVATELQYSLQLGSPWKTKSALSHIPWIVHRLRQRYYETNISCCRGYRSVQSVTLQWSCNKSCFPWCSFTIDLLNSTRTPNIKCQFVTSSQLLFFFSIILKQRNLTHTHTCHAVESRYFESPLKDSLTRLIKF